MAKKSMFRFNVKNLKYAVHNGSTYGSPVELAYANSITLESDYDEEKLYGDGEVLGVLVSDKGKTGTLGVIDLDTAYEIACGRLLEIDGGGYADIQQNKVVKHALYYEINAIEDGVEITIKNWLLGATTGKASETYEQNQDSKNISNFEYSLSVLGEYLQNTAGSADYVDANGNKTKVFRITKYPTDTGYANFESAVPTPKKKA